MPKLFIGNWKMYLTDAEAVDLARGYVEAAGANPSCEAAAAPSYTALDLVGTVLKGSPVALGAQNVFWMDRGAYTGAVSAPMLSALGVRYVIIGHSERRYLLGESDKTIVKKTAAAIRAGLVPVVCVGETIEEKSAGQREETVRRQVSASLEGVTPSAEHPVVVAYEPRWAIGTGISCHPEDVVAMHELIRAVVRERSGEESIGHLRVLYGGSVEAANIASFVREPSVDGVLVGGASTKIDEVRGMWSAIAAL